MKKTVGVIGLGSIGFRHWQNLEEIGVHALGYDPSPKQRQKIPGARAFDDLARLVEASDALVIASPTSEHNNHIIFLRTRAEKPVFVEKPIGHLPLLPISLDQVVMVGYNLRFHPCVIQAKKWLEEGIIGTPLWANFTLAQYSSKLPYLRDGVILNWSHEIDLALYLMGDAEVASSATRVVEVTHAQDYDDPKWSWHDDMTDILLLHKNGCRSVVHLDYITKPEVRQTIIVGSTAAIIFDLVGHQAWLRDGATGSIISSLESASDTWDRTYVDEMLAFIDRIDGKEALGCTADEALKVLDICLEVRKRAGLVNK